MEINKVNFCDGIVEDGKLWFYDNLLQALCCMDMKTYQADVISYYYNYENENYKIEKEFFVCYFFHFHENFYFLSNTFEAILIYNKKTKMFRKVLLDCSNKNIKKSVLSDAFIIGNLLYMVPAYACYDLCSFHLLTEEIREDKNMMLLVKRYISEEKFAIAFPYRDRRRLWYTIWGTGYFAYYDLDKKIGEVYKLNDSSKLSAICFETNRLWFSKLDCSSIYVKEKEAIKEITIQDTIGKGEIQLYSNIRLLKNKLILVLPRYGNFILFIHPQTKSVKKIDFSFAYNKMTSGPSRILNYREEGENILLFPFGDLDVLFLIDKELSIKQVIPQFKDVERKYIQLYDRVWKSHKNNMIETKEYHIKNQLNYFIENSFMPEKKENLQYEENEKNGEKIWNIFRL